MRVSRLVLVLAFLPLINCNNIGLLDKIENPGGGALKSHYIFVSSYKADGSLSFTNGGCSGTGMARADCACRDMAMAAGLNASDQYIAWVSTSVDHALCRVQGLLGMSNTCAPSAAISWYNRKNDLLAASLGELAGGTGLRTAIRYNEHGVESLDPDVMTGTNATGGAAPNNCTNWVNSASVDTGNPQASNMDWTQKGGTAPTCISATRPIYCIRKI